MRRYIILFLSVVCILTSICSYAQSASTEKTAQNSKIIASRYIPKLQRSVAFLGLGTVELGRSWGISAEKRQFVSEQQAESVLKTALTAGFNVVDTAAAYGSSEERIRRYIPQNQYPYLLITKAGESPIKADDPQCKKPAEDKVYCANPSSKEDFSYQAIIASVNKSSRKLRIKTLDVVLLHLDEKTADQVLKKGEALQALIDLKRQGKIRYLGVSINGKTALAAIKKYDLDVIELEYSLLNQSNAKAIELAHKKGMAVVVRGGLGTGLLTADVGERIDDPKLPYRDRIMPLLRLTHNNYDQLTALALAFLYENKNISTVVLGADRAEYIQKDIELLKQFHDYKLLEQAKAALQKLKTPKEFTEIMGKYYYWK